MQQKQYIAIDLKSFYASVECVERGLNPLDACLVVADATRTDKTICLAVSPALKAYGVGGRPRLFEVVRKVWEINRTRGNRGSSTSGAILAAHPEMRVDYIVARPRMQLYLDYSARIYGVYLRHVAAEDIHVYSIDEVFVDATAYLRNCASSARELAMRMIRDVLAETGITATAGIGSNLYLCKVAMDIVAKKMPPDKDGVRIAELDEMSYRRQLWTHLPLTDFWRVGSGIARRLEAAGLRTMGDIARCSLTHEEWFYKQFGVNAELLIDHAWGWEPVTMEEVKAYRPSTRSMSCSQVLTEPYTYERARKVIVEMADNMSLELVEKQLMTSHLTITVSYDRANLLDPKISSMYQGRVTTDHYGRPVPYHSQGTAALDGHTSSSRILVNKITELFESTANPLLLVRRLSISLNRLASVAVALQGEQPVQLNLFTDYEEEARRMKASAARVAREHRCQEAVVKLRQRFGKNAVLKGLNWGDGTTQRERNCQIGGHSA